MRLNQLKPADGAKKAARRVGRGIGSGLGKTCGRGHKGQKSRAGGFHKVGFEGGQMPLHRRLPKRGFSSLKAETVQLTLAAIDRSGLEIINLIGLKSVGVVAADVQLVKVIMTGSIGRKVVLRGVSVTRGARLAIEAAGGLVEIE